MDIAQGRRQRLTPHKHIHTDECERPPEPPADPTTSVPALGSLYNWCVLEGCRSIVKGGKVYTRKGLYGQYKCVTSLLLCVHTDNHYDLCIRLVQMFLSSGHLVQYHVTPKSSLYQRRPKTINLLDAYICSGYFAALTLPDGQYSPSAPTAPRRYQDGLEADDLEEDMLFMVWYRPQASVAAAKDSLGGESGVANQASVPALSAKRKLMIFRTRSKLERDAWCWALNCEIEKITRGARDREERLRETGGLVPL